MIITMTALREIRAGELVTSADVAPYRQTLAEYVARRELMLDYLAHCREAGAPRRIDFARTYANMVQNRGWPALHIHPRDKRPLPLS